MREKVNQFLNSVCSHIKYKSAHEEIRAELEIHIDEMKEKFTDDAGSEEAALDMAINAMGDCGEIGKRLNKQHKPQTEWSIVALTAAIALMGVLVMYVSRGFENPQLNFESYLFSSALGIAVLLAMYFFDYTKLKKYTWHIYLITLCFLIIFQIFGYRMNGARRFLLLGGLGFSMYFVIVLFIISYAGFIEKARGKGTPAMLKLSLLALVPICLIAFDWLSLAAVLAVVCVALIITAVAKNHFGGGRKRQAAILAAGIALSSFVSLGFVFTPQYAYRVERLSVFLSRGKSDPMGHGYQVVMADRWLNASEVIGTAQARINGYDASQTLPDLATDFALVNVFVTLGRAAGIILIIIIAAYIIRMFFVAGKVKNNYGFYLSLSACTVLAVQFVTGIMMNFNLLPFASSYFPFISFGGVGYVSCMAFVGIILSVWRTNNLAPKGASDSAPGFANMRTDN
ncbi:MAG: FtsW/RodA/SpoVE family cell cycle protein [Clostridiales bacterium]|nr:FtsW/RodA/SpoVE family cell cycle protein [Clostridiales bacterium]